MEQGKWQKRNKFFIKKEFQMDFIIKFCALVVIGVIISGIIVYAMSGSTVTTSFENGRLRIKSTAEFILPAVFLSSIVVVVLIGLATIAVTLFTSHRIVGPIHRIDCDLKEVSSGNLTKKFQLRRTDEIKALAESFDDMTETFRQDIAKIKDHVSGIEENTVPEELREKLEGIRKVIEKFTT